MGLPRSGPGSGTLEWLSLGGFCFVGKSRTLLRIFVSSCPSRSSCDVFLLMRLCYLGLGGLLLDRHDTGIGLLVCRRPRAVRV
jgi:hypothetical protein